MRYVICPESVRVRSLATGEYAMRSEKDPTPEAPFDFHRVLASYIFHDPKIGNGWKAAETVSRINTTFIGKQAGDVVPVESEDWNTVKTVIEEPTLQWGNHIMAQFLPFWRAWMDAKDMPPPPTAQDFA